MREIVLYNNRGIVYIDDEDYDGLSIYRWTILDSKGKQYARRRIYENGKWSTVLMHAQILGDSGVDHKDGNGLNNQKSNLRLAIQSQNCANKKLTIFNNTFNYRGLLRVGKNWSASVKFQQHRYNLGTYANIHDAARAYNAKKLELFGEFARLNEIQQ